MCLLEGFFVSSCYDCAILYNQDTAQIVVFSIWHCYYQCGVNDGHEPPWLVSVTVCGHHGHRHG